MNYDAWKTTGPMEEPSLEELQERELEGRDPISELGTQIADRMMIALVACLEEIGHAGDAAERTDELVAALRAEGPSVAKLIYAPEIRDAFAFGLDEIAEQTVQYAIVAAAARAARKIFPRT